MSTAFLGAGSTDPQCARIVAIAEARHAGILPSEESRLVDAYRLEQVTQCTALTDAERCDHPDGVAPDCIGEVVSGLLFPANAPGHAQLSFHYAEWVGGVQ